MGAEGAGVEPSHCRDRGGVVPLSSHGELLVDGNLGVGERGGPSSGEIFGQITELFSTLLDLAVVDEP